MHLIRRPVAIGSIILLLVVCGAAAIAQQPSSPTLKQSGDAKPLIIPVVVQDKKGAFVQNLTRDNFELQIDGHSQPITYFSTGTDLPLMVGLVVDTSVNHPEVLDEERAASSAFLDGMLNSADGRGKAFLIQFGKQTDLLQDVTSSQSKLQAALKLLDPASPADTASVTAPEPDSGRRSGSGSGGRGDRAQHGGTNLYDALFLSSDELMAKQNGRKVLIILSSGDDSGSKETLSSALEAAQRADTVVFAIYFKGKETGGFQDRGFHVGSGYPDGYPGTGTTQNIPRPDGKKTLQRIADETGGQLFEVSRKQTIADIYKQIGEQVRAQYRLGFTPDGKTAADGYHRVILSLTKSSPKDLYLQTRDGYYAGSE
jgi:VWFA-related protein